MSFTNEKSYKLWLPVLFSFFIFALAALALEGAHGSISGRIAVQQSFGLASYKIDPKDKVYALAIGPLEGKTKERGVWVKPDGSFQIDRLPVGEYNLRVRAPGYGTYNQSAIYVSEGKIEALKEAVVLSVIEPAVNIATSTRVFSSNEVPSFWVNASGCNRAVIKIFKQDMSAQLLQSGTTSKQLNFGTDLTLYKPSNKKKPTDIVGDSKPLLVLKRKLEPNHQDWARADFKLTQSLPPGDYLAVVEGFNFKNESNWNLMWFSVSDLGLIIKQAPDQTLVRAIDLNTRKALFGIPVELFDRENGQKIGQGNTDRKGFLSFSIGTLRGSNLNLLALAKQGQSKAYGGIPFWRSESDNYQTYFYTERPIYRLGQTVFFKGIVRRGGNQETPKAGLAVGLVIEDPDNNKIFEQTLRTNSFGSFHGTFEIPLDQKTGAYQVLLQYPDGTFSYEGFEVAQYRKPEYQVEVIPEKNRVLAGEKIKAKIRATYYFGAPVANAKVKYTIYSAADWSGRYKLMPRPNYYSYFDDWESSYEDSSYAGDYIGEGTVSTDENGEASLSVETQAEKAQGTGPYDGDYIDKRYKIQADVTDLSRMTVTGSGQVSVNRGQFVLFVEPKNYVYKAGETLKADLWAIDYEKQAVKEQSLKVDLIRWRQQPKTNEYKLQAVKSFTNIQTNAEGKSTLEFKLPDKLPTDTYYLVVSSKDNKGNTIIAQSSLWLADPDNPYVLSEGQAQQEAFSLKLDKAVYKPGEKAKLMITAPTDGLDGAEALVSLESDKIHNFKVIPLKATAELLEIPLEQKYMPNVYVTVTFVGKRHQLYQGSQLIKVSPEERFLSLKIESDKKKYKPGEKVKYKIQALRADGTPAAHTEVSLGVVDESIYAIRPEAAEDIRKFFYRQKPNLVLTLCSFPESLSGGPDKIEPRLRKDFRDVAAWQPTLITDARGIVETEVQLPDNLTSWRATARAINNSNEVGDAIQNITATQDLLVRLALPRFYREYDKADLSAIVHNYTEESQKVKLKLSAPEQLKISDKLEQELWIKAGGVERYDWPMQVSGSGNTLVKVEALSEKAADAVEQKLIVHPLGLKVSENKSGVLKDPNASVNLNFQPPANARLEDAEYKITLASSSIGSVIGSLNQLLDYPYGCTEQTMSRLIPAIVTGEISRTLGLTLEEKQRHKIEEIYKKSLDKIKDNQHPDGAWGWWPEDESNLFMTAYVLEGLKSLETPDKSLGEISGEALVWLKKNSSQLFKQLQDPKLAASQSSKAEALIDLAQSQYVLSLYGQAQELLQNSSWWLKHKDELPPEALSYLVMAFKAQGAEGDGEKLKQRLLYLANNKAGYLNWDYTSELAAKLGFKEPFYTYRFTGIESTALALRALISSSAEPKQLEQIKNWLLLQRDQNGWQNTKTTALVLRALLKKEIFSKNDQGINGAFKAWLSLNSDKLFETELEAYGPDKLFMIPASKLLKKDLRLYKDNQTNRLYYHGNLNYFLPLKPRELVPRKSEPAGLKIQRTFWRIEAQAMGKKGKIRFTSKPLLLNRLKSGESVLMKIQIQTPTALPYVLIEAPLPSGGEVLQDDPKAALLNENEENDFESDWGNFWWSHQDVLDDKIAFFARAIPAGKSEVQALIRLEMPGEFQVAPVELTGMYSNLIKAHSELDLLKVIK